MAASGKKRDLLSSRRRVDDESGDEEGDVADDTQSEVSVLTTDEHGLADESDLSEISRSQSLVPGNSTTDNTARRDAGVTGEAKGTDAVREEGQVFSQPADVDAMVNGLSIDDTAAESEVLDYEDTAGASTDDPQAQVPTPTAPSGSQPVRGGRGQHRGGYQRTPTNPSYGAHTSQVRPAAQPTSGPPSGAPQGPSYRGKARMPMINRNFPGQHNPANEAKWSHDLHESVLVGAPSTLQKLALHPRAPVKAQIPVHTLPQRPSLSSTIPRGIVTARIYLPTVDHSRVIPTKITLRQHTRLPDLRPPLRRDKAVRVSLPGQPPQYVFPSWQRSFVFIPRAQRPNQQAKLRRGGSRGGSRRTSVHGSVYSPSVAISRRSSFLGNGISPTGSMLGRPPLGAPSGPARPVVRFPPGYPGMMHSQSAVGATEAPYPLPAEPPRREHRSSQMTMHAPRPQKQMSVASIEGQQQPFHQQLPYAASNLSGRAASGMTRQTSQSQRGTPLQHIPESAVHVQPFQPASGVPSQPYYYPMQPIYYYPAPDEQMQQHPRYTYPPMGSPYMQPGPYYMPMAMPMQPPGGEGNQNTYMQENNGMIYYYDPNQGSSAEQGLTPSSDSGAYYQGQPPTGYYQGQ